MSQSERRIESRYKMIYPIAHAKFAFGREVQLTIHSSSRTKDISAAGALFVCDDPYKVGDIVRLEIPIPGWEKYKSEFLKPDERRSHPVVALGKVVHVEKADAQYQIGVHFVDIDSGHQAALKKYFKNIK